ncbi:MAG: hypothetical protein LBE78_00100, partial [Burkholderiaceae bacterium]|nr:hypothetical protein [Burkholderiaceae bacterium]
MFTASRFLARGPAQSVVALAYAAAAVFADQGMAWAEPLESMAVQTATLAAPAGFEGRVEAVRQAEIAAQVPGAVVDLPVQAGQR